MIGRSLGFTRWYDRIPELSQAVRMMEKAPVYQQQLIAATIVGSLQMHQILQRTEHGLKKLGSEKVMGLMKAKGKRRWYDQDATVHQAFNYLYLMDDVLRHEMAIKMIVSMNALDEAAKKGMNDRYFQPLAKAIFDKPLQQIMEKTEFVTEGNPEEFFPTVDLFGPAVETKAPEAQPAARQLFPAPPADDVGTVAGKQPASQLIDASRDGMKIIRLRKNLSQGGH